MRAGRLRHLAGCRCTSAVVWTTLRVEAASGVARTSTRATATRARVTGAKTKKNNKTKEQDDDDDDDDVQ